METTKNTGFRYILLSSCRVNLQGFAQGGSKKKSGCQPQLHDLCEPVPNTTCIKKSRALITCCSHHLDFADALSVEIPGNLTVGIFLNPDHQHWSKLTISKLVVINSPTDFSGNEV